MIPQLRKAFLPLFLGLMAGIHPPDASLAGSISGTITYDGPVSEPSRPGNKALSLDGDGDYVQTPLNDLSGSEITIAYWFKGPYHRSIVRQQSSGYIVGGYSAVHILSNDGGTSGIPADQNGAATIQDGRWHHVAMTWKQNSTDGFASYLDGVLVASRDSSNIPIPDHNVGTYFGSANGVSEFSEGMVDDIAIWSRALDVSEIRAAMEAPLEGNETDLVGYWNFDDGNANDLSAAANHGTLFGDAAIVDAEDVGISGSFVVEATPDSPVNRVLTLDGVDDSIVVDSLTDLSGSEITITYWFKGGYHRSIVRQQSSGYIVGGYSAVHILSNDGGTGGIPVDQASAAIVQDGQWHHVAMTWKQGATDGFASYLDGAPVASRNSSNLPIPNHNIATYFGSANNSSEFANGSVDEITIWNRALSASEIADSWNQRLEGDEAGLVGYWTFDDGTADDRSANGHDGRFLGGARIVSETIVSLDGIPVRSEVPESGPYLVEDATEGVDYFVDAYFDRNGNGQRDPNEWRGSFPGSAFKVAGDVTGIDIALYDPASVWLDIVRSGGDVSVRWPEFATGTTLNSAATLGSGQWEPVEAQITTADGVRSITVAPSGSEQYFRLEER